MNESIIKHLLCLPAMIALLACVGIQWSNAGETEMAAGRTDEGNCVAADPRVAGPFESFLKLATIPEKSRVQDETCREANRCYLTGANLRDEGNLELLLLPLNPDLPPPSVLLFMDKIIYQCFVSQQRLLLRDPAELAIGNHGLLADQPFNTLELLLSPGMEIEVCHAFAKLNLAILARSGDPVYMDDLVLGAALSIQSPKLASGPLNGMMTRRFGLVPRGGTSIEKDRIRELLADLLADIPAIGKRHRQLFVHGNAIFADYDPQAKGLVGSLSGPICGAMVPPVPADWWKAKAITYDEVEKTRLPMSPARAKELFRKSSDPRRVLDRPNIQCGCLCVFTIKGNRAAITVRLESTSFLNKALGIHEMVKH